MGFAAFGLGHTFNSHYTLGMMYGIVPRDVADAPSIETLTIRQTYRLYDWDRMAFYLGGNVYHVLGVKFQASRYGDAPRNYYPVGSLRMLLNIGASVYVDHRRANAFYVEAGLNDIWLTNTLSNRESVNPSDHVSLAVGLKQDF